MFKKRSNEIINEVIDTPEWEEVVPEEAPDTVDALPLAVVEDIFAEDEAAPEAYPGMFSPYPYSEESHKAKSAFAAVIELEDGDIDLSEFPALRMARGFDDSAKEDSQEPTQSAGDTSGQKADMEELVRRYAQLDEEEELSLPDEDHIVSKEELPALFRIESGTIDNSAQEADAPEESQDEFTMESEIARQREISGELFDYIDEIDMSAREIIRTRELRYKEIKTGQKYDPYNLNFNSRYDDTDEVLSSTPEISMAPKYKLED